MAEFRPVGRVQVSLWGRKVGVLVPSPERGYCAFKFDRSFLGSGSQLAPQLMPLAGAAIVQSRSTGRLAVPAFRSRR